QSSVEVYNMLGEMVYSKPLSIVNYPLSVNLSSQSNGVYLYRVLNESGNLAGEGKFIINK
ncbi:MAG TPA: T9SS type A sorting domain-containing protein, partial [Bacteroidia bacterium]|nr:T9SS type A sorting domain-containing protein [Bacteroidia bacterium]